MLQERQRLGASLCKHTNLLTSSGFLQKSIYSPLVLTSKAFVAMVCIVGNRWLIVFERLKRFCLKAVKSEGTIGPRSLLARGSFHHRFCPAEGFNCRA